MGTRGFMGLVIDGQAKIGYVHWDSYPEGLGASTLDALRTLLLADSGDQVATLARRLEVVSPETKPSREQQERLADYADMNVSTKSLDEWYVLLRRTHGDLVATLKAGYVEDASEFPYSSLFCEWGYLIDFDTKTFEAYRGFQHEPHTLGRFATGTDPDRTKLLGHDYYPCALVGMWTFDNLPETDAFVRALEENDQDEE
jgi:hypothetical protein